MNNIAMYEDLSCRPIGEILEYESGTGAIMKYNNIIKTHIEHKQMRATVRIPASALIAVNKQIGIDPATLPKPATAPLQDTYIPRYDILDNEDVGGMVTICVLFYGDYHQLHRQCLESIINTVPRNRRDLRVASNAVCQATLAMFEEYKAEISKHYFHATNAYKYPVMREMFHDPTHPIKTKWVIWFDDDSICNVDPKWLYTLGTSISSHHKASNAHMFGSKYVWTANATQREILQKRPWYRGRPWRDAAGKPSATGQKIIFAVGGFWAITAEAIKAADIPDLGTGLAHNGGDWQIGEQLYQAGYDIRTFNNKKQVVNTSSVPRRGVTTPTIDRIGAQNGSK